MDDDRELDLPERLAHIADYVPKDLCVRCGRLSEVPRARAADGTMTREGPFCLRCALPVSNGGTTRGIANGSQLEGDWIRNSLTRDDSPENQHYVN